MLFNIFVSKQIRIMIQRIQSVWLFLAGITVLGLLFVPIVVADEGTTHYEITANGLYSITNGVSQKLDTFIPLIVLTILVSLIFFVSIFNYKNRKIQKRGISIGIILMLVYSFITSRYVTEIPGGIDNSTFSTGLYIPMAAIIFSMLAIRGINNDEKLIKSADRLR